MQRSAASAVRTEPRSNRKHWKPVCALPRGPLHASCPQNTSYNAPGATCHTRPRPRASPTKKGNLGCPSLYDLPSVEPPPGFRPGLSAEATSGVAHTTQAYPITGTALAGFASNLPSCESPQQPFDLLPGDASRSETKDVSTPLPQRIMSTQTDMLREGRRGSRLSILSAHPFVSSQSPPSTS